MAVSRLTDRSTPRRWRSRPRRSLLAALLAAAVLFLPSHSASAYNRVTHQHLVELAYAYIKVAKLCEGLSLAEPAAVAQCVADCKGAKASEFAGRPEGYTCRCAEEKCDARCRGLSGHDKYVCVKECGDFGEGRTCLGKQEAGATASRVCGPPYYWVPEEGQRIIGDLCGPQCYRDTTLNGSEECDVLAPILASGTLTAERADQVFRFYQGFSASPCPPRSYQYHDQDANCPAKLTEFPQPLADWTEAARGDRNVCSGNESECSAVCLPDDEMCARYKPIVAHLLRSSNARELNDFRVDLTGTILGQHAGVVDKLSDVYLGVQLVPLVVDPLRLSGEIAAGGTGIALAAAVGVGGVVMCGLSCPVTFVFGKCDDCFEGTFDAARDILEETGDIVSQIEEADFLSVAPATQIGPHDFTSFYHFMNRGLAIHDDVDGYRPLEGFGPGGFLIGLAFETSVLSQAFDVRVLYSRSRRSLANYQPQGSDDGMADSLDRGVPYWQYNGFFNYTFPPVDNLAYYWWHKWLQGRLEPASTSYGLLPLGGVLHAVQDITQPFHARGVSLQGHAPYESRIETSLDPALGQCREKKKDSGDDKKQEPDGGCELILQLDEPEQERLFLERVGRYVQEIQEEVLEPAGGVLHTRRLMHFLYDRTVDAPTSWGFSDDKPLLSWFDFLPASEYARETALPLAVAATVVVLLEGATPDLGRYESELRLALDDFEREGDVPPLTGDATGAPRRSAMNATADVSELPPEFALLYPEWVCAGAQPRGRAVVQQYFQGLISGREMLSVLFAERARCDLLALGLPVPGDAALDDLGRLEAARVEASLGLLSHGSLARVDGELACSVDAAPAALVPPAAAARAAARCAGTLDSDGDGVADQNDRCATPRELLARGLPVRPDGCIFEHEAVPLPLSNPFLPGAIRMEQP